MANRSQLHRSRTRRKPHSSSSLKLLSSDASRRMTRRPLSLEACEARHVLASVAGAVYVDVDNDAVRDSGEAGIPGVQIALIGTDSAGANVNKTMLSRNDGSFAFNDLPAGTYRLRQAQPSAFTDGKDSSTVTGATAGEDEITNLVLTASQSVDTNLFGERGFKPQYVSIAWFFASTPESQTALFRETVAQAEEDAGKQELADAIRNETDPTPPDTNTAPTAANDSYATRRGQTLTVPAINGVLKNDTDADGDTLTASLEQSVAHGTLTLNTDGSFTYTPASDFVGTDTFTYKAKDAQFSSAVATVSIVVEAEPNRFTLAENSPAGTVVGTVEPPETAGENILYSLEDTTLPADLVVRPDDHLAGSNSGALVLVQYIDLASPLDADIQFQVRSLENEFSNELLVVRRHRPGTSTVPNAEKAAIAAEAAGRQEAFDAMVDLLLERQSDWAESTDPNTKFLEYAAELELDEAQFEADLDNANVAARVQRDVQSAARLGVTSSPAFFLDGDRLDNADVEDDFAALIEDALADFNEPFVVDRVTGDLIVATETRLDFETQSNWNFNVLITGLTGTSTPIPVQVTLTNVNEWTPTAAPDTYSVPQGTTLTVTNSVNGVLANDTDADGDTLTAQLVTTTTNGTLTLNPNGTFAYIPNGGFAGEDSFTYTASDGTRTSAPAKVTINVVATNGKPVAVADSYTAVKNTPLVIGSALSVLQNDSDPDDDPLTVVLESTPANGTVSFNLDNSFTYTPNNNFTGVDTFTYRASDGTQQSDIATVTITVVDNNSPPVATNDSYTASRNTLLEVPATSGVLANDTDPNGTPLTATLVATTTQGVLTLNANGGFSYSPNEDFVGSDSFTYRASDGVGLSQVATVTITVTATNTAPTGTADSYAVDAGAVLTVPVSTGVLANDDDEDGDTLTAILEDDVNEGIRTLSPAGAFVYTPDPGSSGTDVFTYLAFDGEAESTATTVTITVNATNAPPVAVADSYNVGRNGVLTVPAANGVLANDTDADGDTLTAQLVSTTTNGTFTLNPNGSFVYMPMQDFTGTDSFTYRAFDGKGQSAVTTVTINVDSENTAPIAVADSYTTGRNAKLTVPTATGLLANDTDADGDTLTSRLVEAPANGTLTLNADGSFEYDPNQNFTGTDTFTYRTFDGVIESATTTVTIVVEDTNAAPVAVADSYSVEKNAVLTVAVATGLLANDTDADGDTLTVQLVDDVVNGTLTLTPNGSFTYTPDQNFIGSDTFTYRATDGTAQSAVTSVTISVTAGNSAPVAVVDTYQADRNSTLTVVVAEGVLANDTDADGDTLTALLVDDVANGALTLDANGSFVYTPTRGFTGTDSFSYRASDGTDQSAVATVTLVVTAINVAPVAVADSYSVEKNAVLTVAVAAGVLANDTDEDDDPLTAVLVDDVANGTLTLSPDGSFTYTPDQDFTGSDTFTYRASDGTAQSAVATVTLTIAAPNTAPVAVADEYTVDKNSVLVVPVASGVLDNDTDADSDALTAILVDTTTNGALTLNSDGSFTYTPAENYTGDDSFTYKASDGSTESALATVSITVLDTNTAPVATDDDYILDVNGQLDTTIANGVLVNDLDDEGDTLLAELVAGTSNGQLTLNSNGTFRYTPNTNFSGLDQFTYRATDGTETSAVATVTLFVDTQNAFIVIEGAVVGDLIGEASPLDTTLAAPYFYQWHGHDANELPQLELLPDDHWAGEDRGAVVLVAYMDFLSSTDRTYHEVFRELEQSQDNDLIVVRRYLPDTLNGTVGLQAAQAAEAAGLQGKFDEMADLLFANQAQWSVSDEPQAIFQGYATTLSLDLGKFNSDFISPTTFARINRDLTAAESLDVTTTPGIFLAGERVTDFPTVLATATLRVAETAAAIDDPMWLDRVTGDLFVRRADAFVASTNAQIVRDLVIRDNDGSVAHNTVTVYVETNDENPPVSVDDAYTVAEDDVLTVDASSGVLANDSDADQTPMAAVVGRSPEHGVLVLNPNGSFTYEPNDNFNGEDTFTYFIVAGEFFSANATVTITVTPVNDPPVAVPDSYSTAGNTPLGVPAVDGVLKNDIDVDGDLLIANIVDTPAHGVVLLAGDGTFQYTPLQDYSGPDEFRYRITDGQFISEAIVSITVTPPAEGEPPLPAAAVDELFGDEEDGWL